jgi:uncharacterized protein
MAAPRKKPAPRVDARAAATWPCLKDMGTQCELMVLVVPNAGHTACVGLQEDALRVRLAAPPLEGRANLALQKWLAHALKLPRRAVTLISGDTSRRKRLRVDVPADAVARWLDEQAPTKSSGPGRG